MKAVILRNCEACHREFNATKSIRKGNPKTGRFCSKSCKTSVDKRKHGGAGTPEYKAWNAMIGRCENPSDHRYSYYGARGITVASAWRHDFAAFLAHVGKRPTSQHSLDRINSDGGYEPGNVRWATKSVQSQNRRTNYLNAVSAILVRQLHLRGVSTAALAEATGAPIHTIQDCLNRKTWANALDALQSGVA